LTETEIHEAASRELARNAAVSPCLIAASTLKRTNAEIPTASAKTQHLSGHVPNAEQIAGGVAAAIATNQPTASSVAKARIPTTINRMAAPSITGPHQDQGPPLTVCIIMENAADPVRIAVTL
jgi:hypothetical protein